MQAMAATFDVFETAFEPVFKHPKKAFLAVLLAWLMMFTACNTSWIQQAEQIVSIVAPIAVNILTIIADFQGKGVDATQVAKVQGVINQVSTDLNTANTLLMGYTSANAATTVQKINAICADVQQNMNTILSGLDIKDQALRDRITAIAGIVIASVQTLEGILPAITGGAVSAKAARKAAKLTPAALKAQYNKLVTTSTGNADLDNISRATALP